MIISQIRNGNYLMCLDVNVMMVNFTEQGSPVAQRFSATCNPGCDPGDLGSSPTRAPCMEPASPSARVSLFLSLSLSVCLMNK